MAGANRLKPVAAAVTQAAASRAERGESTAAGCWQRETAVLWAVGPQRGPVFRQTTSRPASVLRSLGPARIHLDESLRLNTSPKGSTRTRTARSTSGNLRMEPTTARASSSSRTASSGAFLTTASTSTASSSSATGSSTSIRRAAAKKLVCLCYSMIAKSNRPHPSRALVIRTTCARGTDRARTKARGCQCQRRRSPPPSGRPVTQGWSYA